MLGPPDDIDGEALGPGLGKLDGRLDGGSLGTLLGEPENHIDGEGLEAVVGAPVGLSEGESESPAREVVTSPLTVIAGPIDDGEATPEEHVPEVWRG